MATNEELARWMDGRPPVGMATNGMVLPATAGLLRNLADHVEEAEHRVAETNARVATLATSCEGLYPLYLRAFACAVGGNVDPVLELDAKDPFELLAVAVAVEDSCGSVEAVACCEAPWGGKHYDNVHKPPRVRARCSFVERMFALDVGDLMPAPAVAKEVVQPAAIDGTRMGIGGPPAANRVGEGG